MIPEKDFGEPEKTFGIVKRCPKCFKLGFVFDTQNNRLICNMCGFEQKLFSFKVMNKLRDWFLK